MVKAPQAGRVKTRLARDIGTAQATYFYRNMMSAVVRRLGADRRWETWLSISPDTAVTASYWPRNVARQGQGRGDLGVRLQRVLDRSARSCVVIIGTDIPGIVPTDIASAFHLLGRTKCVIGPAPDGGYWLIGVRNPYQSAGLFRGVRWSTEHARADTISNYDRQNVGFVRTLGDIDTVADWRRVAAWAGRSICNPAVFSVMY